MAIRFEDVLKLKQQQDRRFEPNVDRIQAVLVAKDFTDSARVRNRPGFVWYQRYDQPGNTAQAVNLHNTPALPGLKVIIQQLRPYNIYEVVDWDKGLIPFTDDFDGPALDAHAAEHEPGGRDPLYVYQRMLTPLRTSVQTGLKVQVSPYSYLFGNSFVTFGGYNNFDLTAHLPAAGLARYVLVYLDKNTNLLGTVAGATSVDTQVISPAKPTAPGNSQSSAWVRLAGGQTTVAESDIVDARDILANDLAWRPPPGKAMLNGKIYSTLSAANAAATAGDTIFLGTGTFTSDDQQLVGVHLVGVGPQTILNNVAGNNALIASGNASVRQLTLKHNTNSNGLRALKLFGSRISDVWIEATATSNSGIYANSDTNYLNNIYITADNLGLLVESGATAHVSGGRYDAPTPVQSNGGNAYLYNSPAFPQGTFAGTTTAIIGMSTDDAAVAQIGPDGAILFDGFEGSTPGSAGTGKGYIYYNLTEKEFFQTNDIGQATSLVKGFDQGARVYRNSDQTITTSSSTAISFTNVYYDNGVYWNLTPNPTRFGIPNTGRYNFGFHLQWETNAVGARRDAWVLLNGVTVVLYTLVSPTTTNTFSIGTSTDSFTAADYLELFVFQDSGGDLDVQFVNRHSPVFWLERIQ